ncbi:MAG: efflux RND transporter periplasmic adaptor subunit [Dehalococcoidia bacterium]|nr:efflux RND transporter periplasmic adaptor subunit [Dehalococcoidia bacterium]
MKKRVVTIVVINMSLLSLLLSGCSNNVVPAGQTYEVKRGDLDIVVSADGSLTMPSEFDLKFGTMGQVSEILVEEGDRVKQGALLAMLDNTAQKNTIKTALFSIQTAKNDISLECSTDRLPYSYSDLSVSSMTKEAQRDLDEAVSYFKQGNYKDAGYKLIMTYFDIEVCEDLIKFKPDAAVLAGAKTNSTYYPDITAGSSPGESSHDEMVVDYLAKYRMELLNISRQMKVGDYAAIAPEFDKVQQEMLKVAQLAKSTVYPKGSLMFEYADASTSADFLQSSMRVLQELEDYIAQGDATPVEAAKKLYIAELNLLVARDVLENQTSLFFVSQGTNWKTLQQYNLSLQSKEIGLYEAKQDIMNTVIIAPSDGTVVSVDLKKSSVLSAQDYSSKTAVKLVDTKSIKFTGLVDEIDILKVKVGQKAIISVDAVPDRTFTGTVKFISPYGTEEGNVVKFALTIELDPYDVELRGGLSATADISVYSAKDVLLVPVSMVTTMPFGSIVTVVNESTGQAEPRRVVLGEKSLQYVEVLSGLEEGDKIQAPSLSPMGNTGGPPEGMPPPPGM